ncbi:MAG: class II fructose-bisphosphate aldolase [Lachnospiraceae bacterium]|nr:class II fructose-bisphosphate aldolase [Lachnospiraceae bacterium]
MIVNTIGMLRHAKENNYAVCSPNIFTLEEGIACIQAGEELGAPVLIDMGRISEESYTLETRRPLVNLMHALEPYAMEAKVPIAFQHDHGPTFGSAMACIAAGFTSIMVDRSELPYEENVAQVAELVKIAHSCGVSVESEIGHVGLGTNYTIDGVSNLTEPDMARDFVERTGVDALAIAVGTAHGHYKGTPHINFDIIDACLKEVDVPLVLHGGSFSGDELLERAAHSGMSKINIATELGKSGVDRVKYEIETNNIKPLFYRNYYHEGFKQKVMHYMKLFGAAGRY